MERYAIEWCRRTEGQHTIEYCNEIQNAETLNVLDTLIKLSVRMMFHLYKRLQRE